MSTFQMKTTEVTIEMDGLHIRQVAANLVQADVASDT